MKLAVAIGIVLGICAAPVCAQQTLLGKYNGSFMHKSNKGEQPVGLTLDITSVADGKVKAMAVRSAGATKGSCAGTYEMQGTYKGEQADLRSVKKSGAKADCRMHLLLVADGNKLKGKWGKRDVQLSK